jgi:NTP pyrophosphatase (non-canonical NTP hydrolase)
MSATLPKGEVVAVSPHVTFDYEWTEPLDVGFNIEDDAIITARGIRFEVMAFALEMEKQLRKNDHKGRTGWKDGSPFSTFHNLVSKLSEEYQELHDAVTFRHPMEYIRAEAADLANIAMMLADNYGGLTGGMPKSEPEIADENPLGNS